MDTIQFAPRNIKSSVEMLRIDRPGDAEPMDLGRVLKGYGVNLPHLLEVYCAGCNPPLKPGRDDKARKAAYHRIYRRLHKLAAEGVITCQKGPDGLVIATPDKQLFYLIRQVQNSNHRKPGVDDDNKPRSIYAWPDKCRPQRIEAIKLLNQYQMLPPDARKEIGVLFDEYMEDIDDRRLVLGDPDNPERMMILPCLNRFNDQGRKVGLLKKYDQIFLKSREYYRDGVFLTLTTDPGRFTSLWHANRHFSKALNRFFAVLYKRFGFRLPYIAVYEFTPPSDKDGNPKRSGLLHCHMILFGRRWLMKTSEISRIWDQCGQGIIVKPMSLRNDPQHGWLWTRAKPEDSGGRDPQQYLKKYLVKALNAREGFDLYWAFNKRFYTYSRRLYDPETPFRSKSGISWIFLGSFPWDSIPPSWELERRLPRPPPEATGPPLLGRPETPAGDRIPLTRWGRLREDYRRRGLLRFRTALEIRRDEEARGALAPVDDASSNATSGDQSRTNPETGRPWSLADFM